MAVVNPAFCFLVLLAVITVTVPTGAHSEPAQPSPINNNLFLHYNDTAQKGWMNADPSDTNVTSFPFSRFGMLSKTFHFPLKPGLKNCNCLVLNISTDWIARMHIVPLHSQTTATIVAGGQSKNSSICKVEGEYTFFKFNLSAAVLTAKDEVDFSIRFPPGGDRGIPPPESTFFTDGSSDITLPIIRIDNDTDADGLIDSVDPDDDNDGYNDARDAYPLDATRWAKPDTSKPMPVWWYALPAAVILVAVALAIPWRRRRAKPGRLPDPKNQ